MCPRLTLHSEVHVIGIRSKTKLTDKVLREAKNLLVVGCFCIGTNQVDLDYAAKHGIAVFNSPFANSRSVAELMIGWIITLARQLGDRSNEADTLTHLGDIHFADGDPDSARAAWQRALAIVGELDHPVATRITHLTPPRTG